MHVNNTIINATTCEHTREGMHVGGIRIHKIDQES